jgi:hypothetical protein
MAPLVAGPVFAIALVARLLRAPSDAGWLLSLLAGLVVLLVLVLAVMALSNRQRLRLARSTGAQAAFTVWCGPELRTAISALSARRTGPADSVPLLITLAVTKSGLKFLQGDRNASAEIARVDWPEIIGISVGTARYGATQRPSLNVELADHLVLKIIVGDDSFAGLLSLKRSAVESLKESLERDRLRSGVS